MYCQVYCNQLQYDVLKGMAKEAKIERSLLSRVDHGVEFDYHLCGMIRRKTEEVFTKLLQEFACEGNDNSASVKSEKLMGYVLIIII